MTVIATITPSSASSQPVQFTPLKSSSSSGAGPSFGDVLDAINPLQHIPVISGLYRAVNHMSISPVSQIAGDTLYGAAFGGALISFASSAANVAVKAITGEDISQHVVATLSSSPSGSTGAQSPINYNQVVPVTSPGIKTIALPTPTAAMSQQVSDSVQSILYQNVGPSDAASHYKRVQVMDKTNQMLTKMGS